MLNDQLVAIISDKPKLTLKVQHDAKLNETVPANCSAEGHLQGLSLQLLRNNTMLKQSADVARNLLVSYTDKLSERVPLAMYTCRLVQPSKPSPVLQTQESVNVFCKYNMGDV